MSAKKRKGTGCIILFVLFTLIAIALPLIIWSVSNTMDQTMAEMGYVEGMNYTNNLPTFAAVGAGFLGVIWVVLALLLRARLKKLKAAASVEGDTGEMAAA
jgi:flagellar basal body-associated protein FliL